MSTFKKVLLSAFALVVAAGVSANSAHAAQYVFTSTLKQGSSGTAVWSLQSFLNMCPGTQIATVGAGSPGHETTTFGSLTKAAVVRFQVANGLVADGVFGPMSGAKATALSASGDPCGTGMGGTTSLPAGCTSTSGFSVTTGAPCNSGTSTVPGCMPGYMYSSTTGAKCDGSTTTNGPLVGTAGDITVTSYSSGLETQVGEGEMNQKVVGFEVKADAGSDVALNSVKVTLQKSSGSGSNRLDRYATTVSIWNEAGVKVGSSSISDFSEDSNVYSRSIALSGVVIKADQKARFFVSVDAVANIDSADQSTYWSASASSIRFTDASGAILTDSTTISKTFQFTSLASASDVELKVNLASDNLKAQTVKVSTTSQTNGVQLLKFTLKAQGSKMTIDQIPVLLTTTTTGVMSVTGNVTLNIDGQSFSEAVSGSGTSLTVIFNDLNLDLSADETVTGTVSADVNALTNNYGQGETLSAAIPSSYVTALSGNYIDVIDVNGDQLVTGDRTGSATGETMTFRSTGVNVTMGTPTITYTLNSGQSQSYDAATYTIPVAVTSFGNTLYIGQSVQLASTVSASNAFAVAFQKSSAPSTDVVSSVTGTYTLSTSDAVLDSGTGYRLDDGTTKHFTITVNLFGGNTAAAYRVALKQIQTFTNAALYTGATSQSLLPVEQFQTNYQNITK